MFELAHLVERPDESIDLFACLVEISKAASPALDEAAVYAQVAEMERQLLETLPPPRDRYTLRMVRCLNEFFFGIWRFDGDREDYYNPANSCIDRILERRLGIPVTLGILYIELARRVGLRLVGVSFPSHFMVRPIAAVHAEPADEVEFVIDVFGRGEVLFVEDVEERFGRLMAQNKGGGEGRPKVQIDRSFLQDTSPHSRAVVTRVLQNLKATHMAHQAHHDAELALLLCRMQDVAAPPGARERINTLNLRDRGLALHSLGRLAESRDCLSMYLQVLPDAQDAPKIQNLLEVLAKQIEGGGGGPRPYLRPGTYGPPKSSN